MTTLVLFVLSQTYQPTRYYIDPKRLPKAYSVKSTLTKPKIIEMPSGAKLNLPPGFKAEIFADNLVNPRNLAIAPNGDLFVVESSRNRITVLRDANHDGKAELRSVFAEGLNLPFGITFQNNFIYVANTGSVIKFSYNNGDLKRREKPVSVITGIPERGYNQHWTRNILFSQDGKKLYLTVGSAENIAEEPAPRASIMQFNADGTGKRVFANGLRNPVGLAWNPVTGGLWATCVERDYMGDDVVPDFITSIKDGGFYGWPYFYVGQNPQPRMPSKPSLKSKSLIPDVLVTAHSVPLGLVFYQSEMFPPEYKNDAFVAFHGSTNRASRTGYKIIRIRFQNGKLIPGYEDFCTGWMLSPTKKEVWGRPAGMTVAKDGSLLIADDGGNRIWRISYKKP